LYGYQKESTNGDLTLAFLAATQEAKKKKGRRREAKEKKQDMFIVQHQQPQPARSNNPSMAAATPFLRSSFVRSTAYFARINHGHGRTSGRKRRFDSYSSPCYKVTPSLCETSTRALDLKHITPKHNRLQTQMHMEIQI
jgi:hypothetical protein